MTENKPNTKHKSQTIECPECGTEIEISEVLSSQLEKDLRKALQQENELKLDNLAIIIT
jgi:hypothetical protein